MNLSFSQLKIHNFADYWKIVEIVDWNTRLGIWYIQINNNTFVPQIAKYRWNRRQ